MTVSVTGKIDRVEVITSVQRGDAGRRRRRHGSWGTYVPGMSVSLAARQHGIAPNQVFTWWRRHYAEGALSAVGAGAAVDHRLRTDRYSGVLR
jgi:transposase